MRETVRRFADAMEQELQANEHKGGWEGEDPDFLMAELECHVGLLDTALAMLHEVRGYKEDEGRFRTAILDDAADIANFAMMIADVSGALRRASK
jgi:hypothetical protein